MALLTNYWGFTKPEEGEGDTAVLWNDILDDIDAALLTPSQKADLTDGGTTALHKHDATSIEGIPTDAAANVGSLRTLGTGALQATAGNDSRLSNDRTPTAHTNTVHSTGAPSTLAVGGANTEGNSTAVARANHIHALPAYGTTAATFMQGNDSRLANIHGGANIIDVAGSNNSKSGYHVHDQGSFLRYLVTRPTMSGSGGVLNVGAGGEVMIDGELMKLSAASLMIEFPGTYWIYARIAYNLDSPFQRITSGGWMVSASATFPTDSSTLKTLVVAKVVQSGGNFTVSKVYSLPQYGAVEMNYDEGSTGTYTWDTSSSAVDGISFGGEYIFAHYVVVNCFGQAMLKRDSGSVPIEISISFKDSVSGTTFTSGHRHFYGTDKPETLTIQGRKSFAAGTSFNVGMEKYCGSTQSFYQYGDLGRTHQSIWCHRPQWI